MERLLRMRMKAVIENIEMAMNGGNYVVTAGISFLEEDKAGQDLASTSYQDKMFWSGEDAFRRSQTTFDTVFRGTTYL